MTDTVVLDRDLLEGVTFLDLGASSGGSLRHCERRFGGRGLGIDIDAKKVATAQSQGLNVICADAAEIEIHDPVRFVSAMDFFEHLPDIDTSRAILRFAVGAATDFLFIRHPSFESEGYLRQLGMCQHWHEWQGHKNHMRISDYCGIFDELGLNQYVIHFIGPVPGFDRPFDRPGWHRRPTRIRPCCSRR